jgi:hypothetical protein
LIFAYWEGKQSGEVVNPIGTEFIPSDVRKTARGLVAQGDRLQNATRAIQKIADDRLFLGLIGNGRNRLVTRPFTSGKTEHLCYTLGEYDLQGEELIDARKR